MNESDFALVVGLNEYKALDPLNGAKGDAQAFADWLADPDGGGLPAGNIRTFFSNSEATEPRLEDLVEWFENLIIDNAPTLDELIGRRLYIFLAGHGIGPDINSAGLLTPTTSLISVKYLAGRLFADYFREAALFEEVVLFMDCCRDNDWDLPDPFFPLRRKVDAGAAHTVRFLYIYATGFGRKSREMAFNGAVSGIFTFALLEGLRGEAGAVDPQGRITGESLAKFVDRRVRELRPADTDQTPLPTFSLDFVLRDGLTPPQVTTTIRTGAPNLAVQVFFANGFKPVTDAPTQIDSQTFTIPLHPDQFYIFQVLDAGGVLIGQTGRIITAEDRDVQL